MHRLRRLLLVHPLARRIAHFCPSVSPSVPGRKSRVSGGRVFPECRVVDANASCPPADFVVFQTFKQHIACITKMRDEGTDKSTTQSSQNTSFQAKKSIFPGHSPKPLPGGRGTPSHTYPSLPTKPSGSALPYLRIPLRRLCVCPQYTH